MQRSVTHSSAGAVARTGCFSSSSTAAAVGTEASCMPASGGGGPGSVGAGSTAGAAAAEALARAKAEWGRFASADATGAAEAAVLTTAGSGGAVTTAGSDGAVTTAGSGGGGARSAIEAAGFLTRGAVKVSSPATPQQASASVPLTAKPPKLLSAMIPPALVRGPPGCTNASTSHAGQLCRAGHSRTAKCTQ